MDISKKSGYFVTVSGDLEIKNWFSNEPLLAAKEKSDFIFSEPRSF